MNNIPESGSSSDEEEPPKDKEPQTARSYGHAERSFDSDKERITGSITVDISNSKIIQSLNKFSLPNVKPITSAEAGSVIKHSKSNKKYTEARIGNYVYYSPPIGKGSYGNVYLGNKIGSSEPVAVKKMELTLLKNYSITKLHREILLLKSFRHPNIVQFYEAFTDIGNNIYIIVQYCNLGDLKRFIKNEPLSEEELKFYMKQLREGLKYLISNNILHRDLKLKNILLHKETSGSITLKIADFGFAKYFKLLDGGDYDGMNLEASLCGSPLYLSPEMLPHPMATNKRRYTLVSDLWSIGIIMYELLYSKHPLKKVRKFSDIGRAIDNFQLLFEPLKDGRQLSSSCKDLIAGLLEIEPEKRLSWNNFFGNDWFEENRPTTTLLGESVADESVFYSTIGAPTDSIIGVERVGDGHKITTNSTIFKLQKTMAEKYIEEEAQKTFETTGQMSRLLLRDYDILNDYYPSSVPKEDTFGYYLTNKDNREKDIGRDIGREKTLVTISPKLVGRDTNILARFSTPINIPRKSDIQKAVKVTGKVIGKVVSNSWDYISDTVSSFGIKGFSLGT